MYGDPKFKFCINKLVNATQRNCNIKTDLPSGIHRQRDDLLHEHIVHQDRIDHKLIYIWNLDKLPGCHIHRHVHIHGDNR